MSEETCAKTAFFRNLLTIDAHCHEWLGASPLRPDAKLFLLIAARGSLTIKEAMHTCSLSNRAFYQMIDRLKSEGKIGVVTDKDDRRVHRIVARRRLRGIPSAMRSLVADMGCLNEECASKHNQSVG